MALVRCEIHGQPQGTKHSYVNVVRPLGYPKTAAICGLKGCERSGLVWLTDEEQPCYERGERIFSVPNAAVKLRVV